MKTEEIQARLERGYTMAIYGTRENIHEQMTNDISELLEAINYTHCCKSEAEQLNVYFNVGDEVLFDNKKAVVLWTSAEYLDIEILGTNKILQGVHTSKVLPR